MSRRNEQEPERTGQLPEAYQIAEVRVENPTVRTLVLDGEMEADPGQFVMAWLPGVDEKPFSPSNTAPLALTVTRVGPFTTAMHTLSPGDRIWLRGPFGQGFTLPEGPSIAIGGGCGAAPLLCLARHARQAGHEMHVVLGARTADGLFFQDQCEALGCTVHLTTDDGSAGVQGTAIDLAARLLEGRQVSEVSGQDLGGLDRQPSLYACGPEPMLEAAYLLARKHSLPCQLSYEAYMRCGIGVCGSCALGGCLVCRDGPVFESPPVHDPRTH